MKNFILLLVFLLFTNLFFAQIINIPDANFKNVLVNTNCVILDDDLQGDADADTNNDGEIQLSEALAVTKIDLFNQNLSSIEGIESFTNLTLLNAHTNNLTQVDVTSLVNLEILLVEQNQLTSLDITSNNQLVSLQCYGNSIQTLDLSQNELLKDLYCQHNELSQITFPVSSALELINARNNLNLNTLDLSDLIELKNLTISDCDFSIIDVSSNINLENFTVSRNNISNLDLSNNNLLKNLYCEGNIISELDIINNPNLWYLECSNNQINSILTGINSTMITLICDDNLLSNLPLIKLPSLITLSCNNNLINQLDASNNQELYTLNCSDNEIDTLFFSSNNQLNVLAANNNQLLEIDLEECPNLSSLSINGNGFNSINVSNNLALTTLYISNNNLGNLAVSNNANLNILVCDSNELIELDITQNTELIGLSVNNNPIETLLLRNGNVMSDENLILFENTPNLNYICVDDDEVDLIASKIQEYNYENITVNGYCSFSPGGDFYEFFGTARVDLNINGCDANDNVFPFFKLEYNDGTELSTTIASENGEFIKYFSEGSYVIEPILENPDYFNVSPENISLSFPAGPSPYNQDFCIIPNGTHNDLEVLLIPVNAAIPGFDSEYKIMYKNKGNTVLSGSVNLVFEDDYMDFLSAFPSEDNQSINNLQWNYANLQPFETGEIDIVFNLNTPTDPDFPLNSDDVLNFNTSIDPIVNDETPNDNQFVLNQTVVNSFDPNDIRCLEGDSILPESVGEYVHYIIRFENLGTANAINVVVRNIIDESKFDIASLVALSGSHDFETRISDGNIVEFIFENIQLPFDDENNDGYLVFKIKTLNTLQLGDTFENEAEIYFDFNFPVITNNYSTAVQVNLNVNDFEFSNVIIYPNPANDVLKISSNISLDSIKIFDINGRLILNQNINALMTQNTISVKDLTSGVYFLEAQSGEQTKVLKFIKQ
jgi:Leucine-rich repeat (LRR) protein